MVAISATWALTETARDVVGVSTGMLMAATTDNVQMLALLACESFGATLAMSLETSMKIELLCSKIHESAVVTFLKAKIGYRRGDCAWQLARSEAGVRFLSLAACISTIDHWSAAQSLHEMMLETASDKKLVPTAQQLKQLILALDYKLCRSGFAENMLGWSLWIGNCSQLRNKDATGDALDLDKAPSSTAVAELVKGARGLGRIGNQSKLLIKTPTNQAAWIVAFLKWCFGVPPSIGLQDGTTLMHEPTSNVILTLDESQDDTISISRVNETSDVTDLVRPFAGLDTFKGMVGPRIFVEKLLTDLFGSGTELLRRAFMEALPYACAEVLSKLRPRRYLLKNLKGEEVGLVDNIIGGYSEESTVLGGQMFPEEEKVVRTLIQSLGQQLPEGLTELSKSSLLEDLPLVQLARLQICRSCPCSVCKNQIGTAPRPRRICKFNLFLTDVSVCVAVILGLSLLETNLDDVLLYFHGRLSERNNTFVGEISSILRHGKATEIDDFEVIAWVLSLLGHNSQQIRSEVQGNRWIISSHYGQTVYPQLLETQTVDNHGILSLLCVPGDLFWKDEKYTLVKSRAIHSFPHSDSSGSDSEENGTRQRVLLASEFQHPIDSFPNYRVSWHVSIGEGHLSLALASMDFPTHTGFNPGIILAAAAQSLFVDCSHNPMADLGPLSGEDHYCWTSPIKPIPSLQPKSMIGIVPCHRNEKMRFFTVASGNVGVIRGGACLQCCVAVCRLANLRFVLC